MPHRITIPGLCYDRCGDCGCYIIRDGEIERLEELIAKRLSQNRGKEVAELQAILTTEKQRRQKPCPQKKTKTDR